MNPGWMDVNNANGTGLPRGVLLRLFECDWKWSMAGAGSLQKQRLADCVANELSNTFNRCGRACSSVLQGIEAPPLMQLERGALGVVLAKAVVVLGKHANKFAARRALLLPRRR